jgi:hypothetical protein
MPRCRSKAAPMTRCSRRRMPGGRPASAVRRLRCLSEAELTCRSVLRTARTRYLTTSGDERVEPGRVLAGVIVPDEQEVRRTSPRPTRSGRDVTWRDLTYAGAAESPEPRPPPAFGDGSIRARSDCLCPNVGSGSRPLCPQGDPEVGTAADTPFSPTQLTKAGCPA